MMLYFSNALLLVVLICAGNEVQAQDTLQWGNDNKLTWGDFKGRADSTSRNLAISSTGIAYSFRYSDTGFTYNTIAFFDRNKSWKKQLAGTGILKHEQGHFDITEIFARKLHAYFGNLKPSKKTIEKNVSQLAEKIIQQKNDFQKKYDAETNFGMNKEAQARWETIIEKELTQ
ncbi:hypothetical protein BH10BAC3_BH10BAC3_32280 [soil metagenome]